MPTDTENLYGDDTEAAAPAPAPEKKAGGEDYPTFLVPKSALGGKDIQPGDTETIRATRVMDDQVEFVCDRGDEETPAEEKAPSEEPEGGGSPMAEMM